MNTADFWLRLVILLRFIVYMLIVYVGLAWVVERFSKKPDSQLKGFFRLLSSPVTRTVSRWMPKGTEHRRILGVSLAVLAVLFVIFRVLEAVLLKSLAPTP